MPDGGESGAGYDETGAETEPEADGSVMIAKGDEVADGEADDPVADDLDDEASVGVARAAESSSGGGLGAGGELEDGGDRGEGAWGGGGGGGVPAGGGVGGRGGAG